MTKKKLLETIIKNIKHRELAGKRLEAELKKLYRNYFSNLKSMLLSGELLSKTDVVDLSVSSKMIGQLDQILKDSGMQNVVDSYRKEFPDITRNALDYFKALNTEVNLGGFSQESFKAYISYSETQLVKFVGAKLVAPVQSGILQATFGQQDRQSIVDKVLSLEDTLTVNQATTLVNDSFAQYQRAVQVEVGDSIGAEVYQYLGPDDDKTSDQCVDMLSYDEHEAEGFAYKDEINQNMVPDLTGNPLIEGGHPNCRHEWVPVTLDYAISQGFVP